jgi:hypothetical protein
MKKTILGIILIMLFCKWNLKSKNYLGIGLQLNQNKLSKISTDTIVPFGFSGAKLNQINRLQFIPSIYYQRKILSKLSLQTGFSFNPLKYNLELSYYHSFYNKQIDTTLRLNLSYLSFPIMFNYRILKISNSSIIIRGGVNSDLLIRSKDNYQAIILEEIAWVKPKWFSTYSASYIASIGFAKDFDNKLFELNIHFQKNIIPFISRYSKWGLFENLYTSRNFRYGIELNYFFNIKNK